MAEGIHVTWILLTRLRLPPFERRSLFNEKGNETVAQVMESNLTYAALANSHAIPALSSDHPTDSLPVNETPNVNAFS